MNANHRIWQIWTQKSPKKHNVFNERKRECNFWALKANVNGNMNAKNAILWLVLALLYSDSFVVLTIFSRSFWISTFSSPCNLPNDQKIFQGNFTFSFILKERSFLKTSDGKTECAPFSGHVSKNGDEDALVFSGSSSNICDHFLGP